MSVLIVIVDRERLFLVITSVDDKIVIVIVTATSSVKYHLHPHHSFAELNGFKLYHSTPFIWVVGFTYHTLTLVYTFITIHVFTRLYLFALFLLLLLLFLFLLL